MVRLAHIYARRGQAVMHADARTLAGFWIAWPPLVTASLSVPADVGQGVREVLAESREGVPTPSRDEKVGISLLAIAGVKSWRALTKSSLGLMLELSDTELIIKGMSHDQNRTALVHNGNLVAVSMNALSDEELGQQVISALTMST
jgi:hypothetical protein